MLCASIGSIMGTEAVKLITGIGEPLLGPSDGVRRPGHAVPDCENSQAPADHRGRRLIDYDYFCGTLTDETAEAARTRRSASGTCN